MSKWWVRLFAILTAAATLWAWFSQRGPIRVFAVAMLLALPIVVGISLLRHAAWRTRRWRAALATALVAGPVLVAITVWAIAPDPIGWLWGRSQSVAGREDMNVESPTLEYGDTDGDGASDRVRIRFSVRNTGTAPALVDRLIVGNHPGAFVGGGDYSSVWLDGQVMGIDDGDAFRTLMLNQKDRPEDAYSLPVKAFIVYFGGCGVHELFELKPRGDVPAAAISDFEINLPTALTLAASEVAQAEGDPVVEVPEEPTELEVFQPTTGIAQCDESIETTFYSITVISSSGQCRTIAVESARGDVVFETGVTPDPDPDNDFGSWDYFSGICDDPEGLIPGSPARSLPAPEPSL